MTSSTIETRKGLLAIGCAAISWGTVPLFIKQGDLIRISTATREYLGKESDERG